MLIHEQITKLHQQIDSLAEQIRTLADQNKKPVNEQLQTGKRQEHSRQDNLSSYRKRAA
jgi:DNA-binding ferritin-like protein